MFYMHIKTKYAKQWFDYNRKDWSKQGQFIMVFNFFLQKLIFCRYSYNLNSQSTSITFFYCVFYVINSLFKCLLDGFKVYFSNYFGKKRFLSNSRFRKFYSNLSLANQPHKVQKKYLLKDIYPSTSFISKFLRIRQQSKLK